MKTPEFDIEKRTFQYSLDLLRFLRTLPNTTEGQVLKKQVLRSGTSIGANIHEAKGGHSKKDFSHYHSIALKSANETVYWLKLIESLNSKSVTLTNLIDETEQLTKIIASIAIKSQQ